MRYISLICLLFVTLTFGQRLPKKLSRALYEVNPNVEKKKIDSVLGGVEDVYRWSKLYLKPKTVAPRVDGRFVKVKSVLNDKWSKIKTMTTPVKITDSLFSKKGQFVRRYARRYYSGIDTISRGYFTVVRKHGFCYEYRKKRKSKDFNFRGLTSDGVGVQIYLDKNKRISKIKSVCIDTVSYAYDLLNEGTRNISDYIDRIEIHSDFTYKEHQIIKKNEIKGSNVDNYYYSYSDAGQLISERIVTYDTKISTGSILHAFSTENDSVIKKSLLDYDKKEYQINYNYDKKNRLKEVLLDEMNGKPLLKQYEVNYIKNGREVSFFTKGKLTEKRQFKYDKRNNLVYYQRLLIDKKAGEEVIDRTFTREIIYE